MPSTAAQRAYWRHAQRKHRARHGRGIRVAWVARCPSCGGSGRGWWVRTELVRVEHGRRKDGTAVECCPGEGS